MMAWQGGKLHGGQRKKPVILLTLLFILASACAALGMSLYGAKVAHTRLWQRLQDQGRHCNVHSSFPTSSLLFSLHHRRRALTDTFSFSTLSQSSK
jgi:hypothetical protein